MSKYKPQHSRLLFIDRKIGEGRYPNCSSLAEEWEVSSKTIQRDLDYMRYQLEAPIAYSAKERGYYYTEENFKLPAISLRESDLFAIFIAEELLTQYEGTPLYASLKSVYQKIKDSLPDKAILDVSFEDMRFTVFAPPSTTIMPGIWEVVFAGLRNLTRISIEYHTPGKEPVRRIVDPYHAVRYDGDWYIIGYCHLRDDVLTFSLSRILSASLRAETFTIPGDYNFQQITSSRFGVHWGGEEVRVTIWFSAEAAKYILERKWHPTQKIRHHDNGSICLELTVNHTVELKKWVLSWGKEAKLIEPTSLQAEMRREALAMQALYTENESSCHA